MSERVLAHVGKWRITSNSSGYSMLVQYEDGIKRFLTHESATDLYLSLGQALRADPYKGYPVEPSHD